MKRQYGGAQSAGAAKKAMVRRARPAVPAKVTMEQIRRALGQELYFKDNVYGPTAIPATAAGAEADPATVLCLNSMASSVAVNERSGEQITLKGVYVYGDVTFTASTNLDGYVRILLVQDNQSNGAQLNSEDVLLDGTGLDVLSFRELSNAKRYRILGEKRITCSGRSAAAATYRVPFVLAHTYKQGQKVNFTGTAGTIANIIDVSLHVIAIASDASMATLTYQSRVRFIP